jgi:hypothetical protein
MPPKGFGTVSIDDETMATVAALQEQTGADSKAQTIAAAVAAYAEEVGV